MVSTPNRTTPAGSGAPQRAPGRTALTAALIVLCQSLQTLAYGGIALFLPAIRTELNLTYTQAGALSAASTLVYALMQIPSGYLADRLGARRIFLAGLVGTNLLALTFALLHSYELLVANQAASGFFRALVFAPGMLLMSALFPPDRRATAMGLYVAAGSSSNVFLNAVGPFLAGRLGWRTLFIAFAAGGLLVTALYGRLGGQSPQPAGRRSFPLRDILALFRYRAMWLVAVIQYVRLSVALGLQFWLPTLLVTRGFSLQAAGLVVALSFAATAPANFLGGYLADRLKSPLLVIGSALAVLAATTFLLATVSHPALLVAVVVLNGIFVQIYFGPLFDVPIRLLGPRTAGVTSGFGNFFANLGGFTFTYTIGALKDATGSFNLGLYALSALCLVGLACTLLLTRFRPAEGS